METILGQLPAGETLENLLEMIETQLGKTPACD